MNNNRNELLATFEIPQKTGTSSEKLPENNGHFRPERLWKVIVVAECVSGDTFEEEKWLSIFGSLDEKLSTLGAFPELSRCR